MWLLLIYTNWSTQQSSTVPSLSFVLFTVILWLSKHRLYYFCCRLYCNFLLSKLFLWTALLKISASHEHIWDTRKARSVLDSENRTDGQASFVSSVGLAACSQKKNLFCWHRLDSIRLVSSKIQYVF